MRKITIITGYILLQGFLTFSYASIKEDVAKCIVRITSGGRSATGFFWKDGNTILTTLHSIGNPNNIEIYIPALRQHKRATVNRVYKNGDIVQLKLDNYTSPSYIIECYSNKPAIDTRAFTIGYNAGNFSYQDRDFTVGLLQGDKLRDLLPSSAENQIRNLGFPSLSTEIVYLQGHLLHGFSGSPIVDYQGRLLGIADGGLENGTASISWCIHAKVIQQLESSFETVSFFNQNLSQVQTLFAAEEVTGGEDAFFLNTSNGYKIRKVKTRSFTQLNTTGSYTSFQEMGLYQLLNMMANSGINYNDFTFDIYEEQNSGARLVLPVGLSLQEDNGKLIAISPDGTFKFKVAFVYTINQFDAQIKSVSLENSLIVSGNPNITIFPDNRLTYLSPIYRPDGMTVNRKAFYSTSHPKYFFEALANKGNTLMGICVEISNGTTYDIYGNLTFVNKTETALYNLAVQLTSFSN
jgi:hypothetical protein